ncbi:MAG TPA: choice-of-anchor J domain-containing protein, partial [Tenuifilaceae bacterium]|nr:choice-of-anchor J domain-containing protein [Tenuifilaceae bacterium]
DTETSGCLSSVAGTGKTTAEMIDITTFLNGGWDFKGLGVEGVWNIGNERNNGYPYLSWQYPEDPAISMEILPSAIITSVTEITQNSANINIEVTNLGIPQGISFGICWSNINPEPTTSDNSQVSAEPFALGSFIQNINGLTHSATYYARAFASNTNGTAYSDVFVFTTECGPITTPFNENFDNSSELPFCWNTIVVNGGHAMVNSWGANSAPNNVSLFAQTIGSNIYLVTPEISGDMSTINLSFMGKSGQTNLGWPSNMVLEIGTMTDPTDASTFTYFTNIQTQDIYELHNVSFTTYPGTDRYIAFRVSSNIQEQNGYVFIDDVNITSNTIPFCDAVDNCDLSYTFGGNANWFSQSDYTYDGVDAVQSGDINDVIGNNEQSWFETTVQGPGIISFWWKVSSEQNYDFLRFYINSEQQNQISGQVDWQYMEYVLLNGENTVRWTYTKDDGLSHYEDCGWVDNVVFTPLTCGSVSGLFADNITINSANLNWTENGTAASWNIQWGEAGFALGEGTIVTGHTSQSLALSGLTPGTLYDFYVQADCGEGDLSLWSSVGSFATECLPFSIPFAENFDNSGSIPVCWNTHNINDGNVVVFGNYSNSAPNMVYLYAWNNTSVATLVTPEIGEDIATLQLSFMAKNYRDNNMILEIGTMSDPTNAGTFSYYTQIQTSANYQLFTIPFNVYAGTDRYIAFRVSSSIQEQTGYVFIDDVSIDVAPSCPAPYNLITNAVTQTTAEVSWTEPGTSTQWDIFYGPAGFDPQTEGTLIEGITTKPYTIEGLNHSTNYEFYVRTYCDETPSGWSAAGSFTTECGAISIPYTENFDNSNSLPLCWNKYEIDGGYVLVYGDLSNSAPNMVYLYASSITSIATLVTPEIGENIAALQLSFMAKNYNDNNMILEIGTMSDPTNAG